MILVAKSHTKSQKVKDPRLWLRDLKRNDMILTLCSVLKPVDKQEIRTRTLAITGQ